MPESDLLMLEFDLGPNEASGLERLHDQRVLAAHGWDLGFWAVLDDVAIDEAIGLIGHRRDEPLKSGWEVDRLQVSVPDDLADTEDAEAVTTHDGWVYVLGSHFGSKDGPLQAKRQFVARFREQDVAFESAIRSVELEVVQTGLQDGLHRIVNDGLQAFDVPLRPNGDTVTEALLRPDDDTDEVMRPSEGDWPINIEGAEFLADGTLFVGLRWPVHESGKPLLLAMQGVPDWFEHRTPPRVTAVYDLDAIGDGGQVAGVRDLAIAEGMLQVVTGNVDSRDQGSVVLADHPEGAKTVNTHWRTELPATNGRGTLPCERVRPFPDLPRIEGIANAHGFWFYASDEDDGVDVRFTRFVLAE